MADPVRQNSSKEPSSAPRRRVEIVRKRLSQPQQTTAQWDTGTSHRSQDASRPPSLVPGHLSEAPSKDPASTRPLKRKISTTTAPQVPSDRPENRNVNPTKPLLDVSSYPSHVPLPRTTAQPAYAPHPNPHPNPLNHNVVASTSVSSSQKRVKSAVVKSSSLHHTHDAHNHRNCSVPDHSFTGPLAAAEFQRMRKEIESLKEALHEVNKTAKKQIKKLDENKTEISAMQTLAQAKELELTLVKEKHKKAEEVLSTIEMSIQCQICMDLPEKPFALSPCGHVLCLLCLQEWFKKAPPSLDDMDITPEELSDPNYILMRSKSCPTCRATIKRRPAPVFMVKAVAAVLMKHNNVAPIANTEDEDADAEDPWEGIFASSDEDDFDDDDDTDYGGGFTDEEEEHSDFGEHLGWYSRRPIPTFGFRSRSDDEDEEEDTGRFVDVSDDDEDDDDDDASNRSNAGAAGDRDTDEDEPETRHYYIQEEDVEDGDGDDEEDGAVEPGYDYPHWAPPARVRVDVSRYDILTQAEYKLLQRGCTMEMVRGFDVTYEHESGIILRTQNLPHLGRGIKRMFLGWNIHIPPGDVHGVRFVMEMLADVIDHRERWAEHPSEEAGCVADVHLLVPPDVGDYDTTDSEAWMDDED
ncbi:hypothetical protein D9619_006594 [Psilocybe cf. subviscida]|uniref:RING-type domain-containing protein n=1 Tax=Psilocybe cf. subviscida TaxID=2480587 RepID=A0A8H5EY01_9AGAR|nr:hypothetical protein D9619_006594 [Psilocybe cf. subviscida]